MTALDRLLALPRFADAGAAAYSPGLDRMRALLAGMGHPERAAPSIHVAGTNGKGSTASMAAAIATASGLRVGLHTSPHLRHIGERMRVDGVPAADGWLDDATERHARLFARVGPSFFEATTALAFLRFAEAGVDLAVIEVGLGGRLDATNVLTPRVSVVTSVGLDHTDLLGDTLARHRAREGGHRQTGRAARPRRRGCRRAGLHRGDGDRGRGARRGCPRDVPRGVRAAPPRRSRRLRRTMGALRSACPVPIRRGTRPSPSAPARLPCPA